MQPEEIFYYSIHLSIFKKKKEKCFGTIGFVTLGGIRRGISEFIIANWYSRLGTILVPFLGCIVGFLCGALFKECQALPSTNDPYMNC